MKVINMDTLQVGDIVLTTSTQKPSAIIRALSRSDISHAMICVSPGSVIDSTLDRVQARNVQKILYEDDCSIYIMRHKVQLPPPTLKKIVDYARSLIGTPYSFLPGDKQYCSRLVATAYAKGGIHLVKNVDVCTPGCLKKSSLLDQIEPASIQLDDTYDLVNYEIDTTEIMRRTTQTLLDSVSKYDPSVLNLNDVCDFAIRRPELDQVISAALSSSGYLSVWLIDQERFPWRYCPDQIIDLYHSLDDKSALLWYCNYVISTNADGSYSHYEINLQNSLSLNSRYPRLYFRYLIDLYKTLCDKHNRRVNVARKLLSFHESLQ